MCGSWKRGIQCIWARCLEDTEMTKHSVDDSAGRKLTTQTGASRIIEGLADLSFGELRSDRDNRSACADPSGVAKDVAWLIEARRLRGIYFPVELVSTPAWDILLELLRAGVGGQPLSSSRLCAASHLPGGNAGRWLNALEEWGLVTRPGGEGAAAGELVELSPEAFRAFGAYFEDLARTCGRRPD